MRNPAPVYPGVLRDHAPERSGRHPVGIRRDSLPVSAPIGLPVAHVYVLEGQVTGAATVVPLKHGGVLLTDLAIPSPVTLYDGHVAVSILVVGSPTADTGLLTMQIRDPGTSSFYDAAYFTFDT